MSPNTHHYYYIDWHPWRDVVLDLFEMHPAIKHYVQYYYGSLLNGPLETVSLHLRFGYNAEPNEGELEGSASYMHVTLRCSHDH